MSPTARPLSPHLQVYRRQIQMVTSILHRITGVILVVGSLLVAAVLLALASGAEPWARAQDLAGSWFGLLVLVGWTWALAYHWINGIRHLLQDAGWGYSIPQFVRNGWISVFGSLALTLLVWGVVYCWGGTA